MNYILKSSTKYSPQVKNNQASLNNLRPINSQRNKANSQIYNKYNKKCAIDIHNNVNTPNKYRIITEPVDQHIIQLTKSYSRLSKPKNKEPKMESQHNSIRSRQKTTSNQKYIHIQTNTCARCSIHERQMNILQLQIETLIKLKDQWKSGTLVLNEFERNTQNYIQDNLSKPSALLISHIRQNVLDLMKDIEALTEIDYSKLLSSHSFDNLSDNVSEDLNEFKSLFMQLRNQINGYVTDYDLNIQGENEIVKMIIRNLKTNLANSLRKNVELKTLNIVGKRQEHVKTEDIQKIVNQVLKGIKR